MAAAVQTQNAPNLAGPKNGDANPASDAFILDQDAVVPLNKLKPKSERIQCPHCKKQTQTRVEKTGTGGRATAMKVAFWPMKSPEHWFEWTHWYCTGCSKEVAKQKWGKPITVNPDH